MMYVTVTLVVPVNTGNVPYDAKLYEVAVPVQCLEYWKKTSVWDTFTGSEPVIAGKILWLLEDIVIHMVAKPEEFLLNEIFDDPSDVEKMEYHTAMYYMANLLIACRKFPNAEVKIRSTGGNNAD